MLQAHWLWKLTLQAVSLSVATFLMAPLSLFLIQERTRLPLEMQFLWRSAKAVCWAITDRTPTTPSRWSKTAQLPATRSTPMEPVRRRLLIRPMFSKLWRHTPMERCWVRHSMVETDRESAEPVLVITLMAIRSFVKTGTMGQRRLSRVPVLIPSLPLLKQARYWVLASKAVRSSGSLHS